MTDLDPAPALSFSDGRGLLSVTNRPLPALVTVQRLEVEFDQLRAPADLAGGAERLRNRRGRLRTAAIVADADGIARYLAGCDLGPLGFSDVSVQIDGGGGRLSAWCQFGDRKAGLTARITIDRAGVDRVRLATADVRVYGFLPVPAATIVGALVSTVSAGTAGGGARTGRAERPTARSHLELDVLELALLEVFAATGWRLPDRSATALDSIVVSDGRVALSWDEGTTTGAGEGARRLAGNGGGTLSPLEEADGLLARGDHAAALARYRDALDADADDLRAAGRVLEILSAGAQLGEAETLAETILARRPEFVPALLARAVAAAERGDGQEAARRYLAVAERVEQDGDRAGARFAREAAKASGHGDARPPADRAPAGPEPAPDVDTAPTGADAASLEEMCQLLVTRGELEAADRVFEARIAVAPDEETAAALATERARVRMLGPGGAEGALAVLRTIPLTHAPEEALILRADLGERLISPDDAVPALNELLARARTGGDDSGARELASRITMLLARVEGTCAGEATAEELEEALATNPTDPAAAEELARLYSQIDSPSERAQALAGLLRRALGLSSESRKKMYMSLGESAEATGDLDSAEQAYWRAATIEAEPALRANYLVCHARVLLARDEVQTAIVELDEALARVPLHAGALALLADVSFRTQDWERARTLYAALDSAPNAADVITREQLMNRRAVLAEAAGDDVEAEACYREVAILSSRHVDARRSLAELALRRGDLGAAALRLEEVLRLLPLDALEPLLDVRQRLGAVYVQLQDWASARYYLELVLAQDPVRVTALELLVDVYQRQGLYRDAAQACERLARLYFEPSRRAQILYRQGEILRAHVGDQTAASSAFLKASDLDPRFVPTMIRLVDYFWQRGEFETLAEIAVELRAAAGVPGDDAALAAKMEIGSAIAAGEMRPEWNLAGVPWDASLAARTLAQAAAFLGAHPPHELDPGLSVMLAWEGDGLGGTLRDALEALVLEDPSNAGAVRALAWMADRRQQLPLARALYGVLVFVDPEDGAAGRLAELGPAPAARPEALRVGSDTDHPEAAGPLRLALAALSAPLQGWPSDAPPAPAGETLRPARAAGLRRLGQLLQAPPFTATIDARATDASTTSDGASVTAPPRASITVLGTRPATLLMGADAAALPDREWGFVAAHALEQVRNGTAAIRDLGEDDLLAVLRGVSAALTGGDPPEHPRGGSVAAWLTRGDPVGELPVGAERARLVEQLQVALYAPLEIATFLRGCTHTANRLGLLIAASPLDALKALARRDPLLSTAGDADVAPGEPETRRGFVRTSTVRELIRYMLSVDYEQALGSP